MGDSHDLGQHGHVIRQGVRHAEEHGARQQDHVFRPAAEQMGRAATMQAVAVILQVLAHVIGVAVEAGPAAAAGDVGAGNDAVAAAQHPAFAVEHLAARGHDLADIFVPADQRVGQVALMWRAAVLFALAEKCVFIGAADARVAQLQDNLARFGVRYREGPETDLARPLDHGRPCCRHSTSPRARSMDRSMLSAAPRPFNQEASGLLAGLVQPAQDLLNTASVRD